MMNRQDTFNFSAGPSMLPTEVLEKAAAELLNYRGCGMSVMEMSHRSSQFMEIFHCTRDKLRAALSVPETHEILFLQGGASTQFSAIPLNLSAEGDTVDYAITGNFSSLAAREAKKYCSVHVACSSEATGFDRIPAQSELSCSDSAAYFYYCSNNTIYGTAWNYVPDVKAPLVCDMSSEILSREVDVSKYALIYAGAQKNMAPAGLTVVIVDKSVVGHERAYTPLMLGYELQVKKDSMYNTPPCYNIYMLGLVLDWLEKQGGVKGMEAIKHRKAAILYDYLAGSRLFRASAQEGSRSDMNVTFRTGSDALDAEFVKYAAERGLLNLKGHRVTGGMRASIYNAMPEAGVIKLIETMKKFEVEHHV